MSTPLQLFAVALLNALLVALTVVSYRRAKAREAAEVRDRMTTLLHRITADAAAMDRAMIDSQRCEVCHTVSPVRELVLLHDDTALCCLGCAAVLRPVRVP
jgi:Tfp pilus assembly protein PilN